MIILTFLKKTLQALKRKKKYASLEVSFEGYCSDPDLFRFEIGALEKFSSRDVVREIQEDKLDGIIVEGLFSKEIAALATERLLTIQNQTKYKELTFPTEFGEAFGATLMEFDDKEYLRRAELSSEVYEKMFDNGFLEKIQNTLQKLSHNREVSLATTPEGGKMAPVSVRILSPEHSSLEAHIHQEFPSLFPLYKWVTGISDISTELSFYIVLQAPEQGGELILYNLRWSETPPELLRGDTFLTAQRSMALSKYKRSHVRLRTGDMVVFAANRIWHQIQPVKAPKNVLQLVAF